MTQESEQTVIRRIITLDQLTNLSSDIEGALVLPSTNNTDGIIGKTFEEFIKELSIHSSLQLKVSLQNVQILDLYKLMFVGLSCSKAERLSLNDWRNKIKSLQD